MSRLKRLMRCIVPFSLPLSLSKLAIAYQSYTSWVSCMWQNYMETYAYAPTLNELENIYNIKIFYVKNA